MRSSLVRLSGIRQGNFSNHHIKGIASIQVSAFETNPFRDQQTGAYLGRSFRRFNESWYKWVPVFGAYYAIMAWADEYEHHLERKNPADFANDE